MLLLDRKHVFTHYICLCHQVRYPEAEPPAVEVMVKHFYRDPHRQPNICIMEL